MKRILPLLLTMALLLSFCLTSCDTLFAPAESIESSSTESSENEESINLNDSEQSENTDSKSPSEDSDNKDTTNETDESDSTSNGEKIEHIDEDDNGLCDDCGISVIIVLDIFGINDLHGKFCDSSAQAGVDEMTTYLKNAYKTEDHVLILSSGDMWQGSSESNLTKGLIVTEWMNELDFVSMTLGNHEFDWGEDYISNNAAIAEFPFLAINIFDKDTGEIADYCTPSVLVERGGATIGIIGAIGDCYSSISGEFSSGFYFKVGDELTELVKDEATRLREAGADFIIYSLHDGHSSSKTGVGSISDYQLSSYYDVVLSGGYVDIVFEGHTHRSYTLLDSGRVYHLQDGGDNEGISHAEAVINFANGNCSVNTAEYIPSSVYSSLPDDPIVEELMKKYEEQVSEASRVLGMNDTELDRNELRQLVSKLYLEAGLEMFGDEYDIVLGGGFFSVRDPGYLAAGLVTMSQLQMIFPFENTLVLCSIKGSDLLSKFINTTNSNYFISYSEYGESIKNNIDRNATYYVITDTYSSTYASNRLTEIKRYTEGIYAYNLLAKYVEAGGLTSGGEITYTTIPEIIEIGNSLSAGSTTDKGYYVEGTVTSVTNTTYGNIYIEDSAGNQLYVFGVYDATGALRYDAMTDQPKVGDTVVLYGKIMHYVNQSGESIIEMKSAHMISKS